MAVISDANIPILQKCDQPFLSQHKYAYLE